MAVPLSNLTASFANSSLTYTAIGMNVTSSGYSADSTLLNLNVNGESKFSVDVDGFANVAGGILSLDDVAVLGDVDLTGDLIVGGSILAANLSNVSFSSTSSNKKITTRFYEASNGTLSFESTAGQLFSITNDLSGSIFSVNDISGIPSIDVNANGNVYIVPYNGTAFINKANIASLTVGATSVTSVTSGAVSATTISASGSITSSSTISDSKGNVRSIPQNSQTSAYVLVAADAGKHISITTGGVTLPASVFSVGDAIVIFNNSGSSQSITTSAVTCYLSGTTTSTSPRTLGAYGVATILCVATNTFVISGSGLT